MADRPGCALITGITGQDGWYLAKRLLELGHDAVGTTHRTDLTSMDVAGWPVPVLRLASFELTNLQELLRARRPSAVFNLAARASSAQLFDDPLATAEVNGVAVARWLEAIRRECPATRFCQASSSEIFAGATTSPQDESTAVRPLSAYGAAKAYADHLVAAYRSTHGLFACSAVLYSHESPRRPGHFLMRKVALAAARIASGIDERLLLGDLDAVRDWGYAADYMEAMRLMLAAKAPRDYVIATGQTHTVKEVCELAFAHVGLDWRRHVDVDQSLKRAPETILRVGNAARARQELSWEPRLDFQALVRLIVDADRTTLAKQTPA
ncbi:MAG TPA: GDP-mannose 4,6-dehydratase [Polyangiaceae bacterium]|nr:GDP-mannose 4,6-dehydratase [Polyangiaceae bacterium]